MKLKNLTIETIIAIQFELQVRNFLAKGAKDGTKSGYI